VRLYDFPRSGNCHKVRMLLAFLQLDWDAVPVDTSAGGTRTPEFLALNPRGQIPVLEDDGLVIWDSMAILCYLARRHGPEWLPMDAAPFARVMQWLAVSENELLYGLARARAALKFGRPCDMNDARANAESGLKTLETQLSRQQWLAVDRPTVADVACYPYVALAPEAEVNLAPYPGVRRWLGAVQALPNYVGMAGMFTDAAPGARS